MVVVRLVLVLQDLLADALHTLLQGIRHAVGPGDRALLPAVELLREKVGGVRVRTLAPWYSGPRPWHPPPCSPHHLAFTPAVPCAGDPASVCPFHHGWCHRAMQGTREGLAQFYLSFKASMESLFDDRAEGLL